MKIVRCAALSITKALALHIQLERSLLPNPEQPLVAYSVEKLCFEMSGDFICDLNGIAYCMYEGGSRSRMKIRPDATQNGTIDL